MGTKTLILWDFRHQMVDQYLTVGPAQLISLDTNLSLGLFPYPNTDSQYFYPSFEAHNQILLWPLFDLSQPWSELAQSIVLLKWRFQQLFGRYNLHSHFSHKQINWLMYVLGLNLCIIIFTVWLEGIKVSLERARAICFLSTKGKISEISGGLIDPAAYRIVNTRPSMTLIDQWQSAQLIANSKFRRLWLCLGSLIALQQM